MPAHAAHASPTAGARPAEERARVVGGHAPAARVAAVLGPRPGEVAVEDVAARHGELALEVERRARLDARRAVGVAGDAVADRLGELLVEPVEGALFERVASRGLVRPEQAPRRGRARQGGGPRARGGPRGAGGAGGG